MGKGAGEWGSATASRPKKQREYFHTGALKGGKKKSLLNQVTGSQQQAAGTQVLKDNHALGWQGGKLPATAQ